jgi:hypothetical protein
MAIGLGPILRARMLRVVEDHLGSTQVSRVIYGAIIGAFLIARKALIH